MSYISDPSDQVSLLIAYYFTVAGRKVSGPAVWQFCNCGDPALENFTPDFAHGVYYR